MFQQLFRPFLGSEDPKPARRPLRILQVSHMFLDGGGREEHILEISKQLVALGHEVTVLSSDYMASGKPTIGNRAKKIPGLTVVKLKGTVAKIPPGRVEIPDLLDYILENNQFDVIHAHGMGERVPEDALYGAKIKGIPFIFTPHFQPWTAYEKLGSQQIWRVLQTVQMPTLLRHADRVIAVSPPEQEDMVTVSGVSDARITYIPNGLEPTLAIPSQEVIDQTFARYGVPAGNKYMIFLGSVTNPRKGAFEAVQAFRQVRLEQPDTHLIMVGPWGSRYMNTQPVMQIMQKLTKARYVTITGYVPEKDKYALLAGSDVMISPTVYEAFGIAIAESLFMKVPVVATRIGGVKHVVDDGKDGLLIDDQKDIRAFAQASLKLLSDDQLRARFGAHGHARVQKFFRWDEIAEQLADVYYEERDRITTTRVQAV